MFSGQFSAKTDAKGRVFLPSVLRKQLGEVVESLVLRRDVHQPCLVLFPWQAWEQEVALLRTRLNRWDERDAMVFRCYVGDSEQISLDTAGRLLLSKHWLQVAEISKEVVFIGNDDRIEIWASEKAKFFDDRNYSKQVQEILGNQ
ncbi:MAG: cell division/cell wall cluster transcriptional repressor MraZ [Bacteroidaceae bacterium]|nr:cell division/cell wall cluster transcriptional repressor MraZ [Bacteroidaceae bacterium]